MFRILLAVMIGGAALAYFGVQEMRLSSAAKAEPATMTCAELIESGPGDNAHVVVGDFLLCDFAFVYQTRKRSEDWQTVWVPAVPLGGEFHQEVLRRLKPDGAIDGELPPPRDVRVIVKSSACRTEADLTRLAQQDTLQGMVVNKIEALGSKERKILAESYPGVDFDRVWILEHDRHPSSAGKSLSMMGGGGLLSALGVLGIVRVSRRR